MVSKENRRKNLGLNIRSSTWDMLLLRYLLQTSGQLDAEVQETKFSLEREI